MSTCDVTGSHPVEVDLRVYGPGESVTGVDEKTPHNQALIESGQLTPRASKKAATKPAEVPDAGQSGKTEEE